MTGIVLIISILFSIILVNSWMQNFTFHSAIKLTIASSFTMVFYSILYFIFLVLCIPVQVAVNLILVINIILLTLRIKSIGKNFQTNFNFRQVSLFILLFLFALMMFVRESQPWGKWDGWAIWNLHARFLFYTDSFRNLFTNKIYWTHPDYPLMLPSFIAFFWKCFNHISFSFPFIAGFLPFAGILFVSFYAFKNRITGIILCVLFIIDLFFIQQAASQYADTLLAFFYLLSVFLFEKCKVSYNRILFFFAGFMAASCFWIKNEGIVFFIFFSLAFILQFYKEKKLLFSFFAGTFLLIVVVGYFKLALAPPNDLVFKQSTEFFNKITDVNRYLLILKYLWDTLLQRFPILLILFFIMLFTTRNVFFSLPVLVLTATFIGYLAVYVVSPYGLEWHLETSLDRLIHQIYPPLLYLIFRGFDLFSFSQNLKSTHISAVNSA